MKTMKRDFGETSESTGLNETPADGVHVPAKPGLLWLTPRRLEIMIFSGIFTMEKDGK